MWLILPQQQHCMCL